MYLLTFLQTSAQLLLFKIDFKKGALGKFKPYFI